MKLLISWLLGLTLGIAAELPGVTPPSELLESIAQEANLTPDELSGYLWVTGVEVKQVQRFISAAGKEHIRFLMFFQGKPYSAIMYEGDWTEKDFQNLKSGQVGLLGAWDLFRGQPSFEVKYVRPLHGSPANSPTSPTSTAKKPLVQIRGAKVSAVEKYISSSQRQHVRYQFLVNGKTYWGIAFAGDWNSDMLQLLRSGTVTLIGYWDEFEGQPSFVTTKVVK